jgi:hypothetical protein
VIRESSKRKENVDLRPEYDLSKLKGGVRGKYYRKATAGANLVLIEPELTNVFPDSESVNRALRLHGYRRLSYWQDPTRQSCEQAVEEKRLRDRKS